MSGKSLEVTNLIDFMYSTGLSFKISDIDTPGVHSSTSYHYRGGSPSGGCAIDLAKPGVWGYTLELMPIFNALWPHRSLFNELIYKHPDAPKLIKAGKEVPAASWGSVLEAHRNHVHVALKTGQYIQLQSKPIINLVTKITETLKEGNVKRDLISVKELDEMGNGVVSTDIDYNAVISVSAQGNDANVDGKYWTLPVVGYSNSNGRALLEIWKGPSKGAVGVFVVYNEVK